MKGVYFRSYLDIHLKRLRNKCLYGRLLYIRNTGAGQQHLPFSPCVKSLEPVDTLKGGVGREEMAAFWLCQPRCYWYTIITERFVFSNICVWHLIYGSVASGMLVLWVRWSLLSLGLVDYAWTVMDEARRPSDCIGSPAAATTADCFWSGKFNMADTS